MAPSLTLYHYWRSTSSWRVRWALAHKNLAYTSVAVDLLKDEQHRRDFVALNPMGMVPVLVAGREPLGESMAILEWLEETFPEPPLLPRDPIARAKVRQVALTVVAGIQPLQNSALLKHYSTEEPRQHEWARHWITRGLTACESMLASEPGPFCFGDKLTIADLCLVPQVGNMSRFGGELTTFPRCRAIYEHCLTLESCRTSSPTAVK